MDIDEMEKDPVVREIPVFLCKDLREKLFLVQYPIRPATTMLENIAVESSIRPKNQEIRMELKLNSKSANYNYDKGKRLAVNADDYHKDDDDEDDDSDDQLMDRITLHSSRALVDSLNHAVAVFQDDELHITPLEGIVQIRQQFDYLDESDKQKETKNVKEDVEPKEDLPVKVTFARLKPDHLKKLQEQSFQYHTNKNSEERWIDTKLFSPEDSVAELTRFEMMCTTEESNSLCSSKILYLESLILPVNEKVYLQTNLGRISHLPLLEQIKAVMKEVKVISFADLRSILSAEHDTTAVVRYLQQVAVLVQGNWVVNSELLYPKDTLSSHNSISAEIMRKARDYILLSFTGQQFLDRKAISSVIKLPRAEVKEIFINLAKREPKKGWQLIVPPNWEFCDRFPDIVQRQDMYWESKRKNLRETIEAQNHPPQRQRRKSNRESQGCENEERNIGRGRKSSKDLSSDDNVVESGKHKKSSRSRKTSEATS